MSLEKQAAALQLRDINDYGKIRDFTYDNVINAFQDKKVEARNTIFEFQNVKVDPKEYSLQDQKKAILNNRDLTIPIKGTAVLRDKQSGKVLDQKNLTLGQLPYYTPRGTYIVKGNEYGVFNQFRLKPGVYTRIKASGEAEAQFNMRPGVGRSFKIMLVPETGVFTFVVGQARDMPVYTLLHFARIPDHVVRQAWGDELFEINRKFRNPQSMTKLFERLFSARDLMEAKKEMNPHEKAKFLLERYAKDSFDARVNRTTIGMPIKGVNIALLLAVTQKLIKVNKREVEPDDRDSLEFRTLMGPEDYFSEQIKLDPGQQIRKTAYRADREKNLDKIPSGAFTRMFKDFVTRDSRTAALEQLNPMEIYEVMMKTTPLGEGGLSEQSVPESSRNVNPSHFTYLDPLRTPECFLHDGDKYKSQVFTKNGWKDWPDVTKDDYLACRIDGKLEFHKPIKLIKEKYEGPAYGVKTGPKATIEFYVTPNHDILFCRRYGSTVYKKPISEVYGSEYRVPSHHKGYEVKDENSHIDLERVDIATHSDYIWDLPTQSREKLYRALLESNRTKGRIHTQEVFTTTKKKLALDFERLAISLGKPCRMAVYRDTRKDSYKNVYKVRAIQGANERTVRKEHQSLLSYKGYVYCATVPGGLLYIRTNNSIPVWTGNSTKAGLDLKLTYNTKKGRDGKIYSEYVNAKTGKSEYISAEDIQNYVVAFPGQRNKTGKLQVMKNKKVTEVPAREVDYHVPDGSEMFTVTTNMIPLVHASQGNRMLMGAKAIPQALPMREPEAPFVRAQNPKTGKSFDEEFGRRTAAVESKVNGTVSKITDDIIEVTDTAGAKHTHELYNNFLYNRKTAIHQTPVVKLRDRVRKGQLLARSNFTDDQGAFAYGKNLNVGYLSYKGHGFEDAIIISESAADKLTSEHTYSHQVDLEDGILTGKNNFISTFPTHYTSEQLSHLDDDGVAKKGSKISYGMPIILAAQERTPSPSDIMLGRLHKTLKQTYRNISEEWEHHGEGEVVEVIKTPRFYKVAIRVHEKMTVGDKLSSRHGNKGVISKIIPDNRMPHNKEGEPLEVLLNAQGLITRINPGVVHETLLGKAAKKTGKPYSLSIFETGDTINFVENELKKAGLPTDGTEEIVDPESGHTLGKVLTGQQYMMKTSSTAEKGISAQASGNYSSELRPVKGKKIGNLTMKAILSHGARDVVKDMVAHKSQQNNDFWRSIRNNMPPPPPKPSFMYDKFQASLKAAGVNTERRGDEVRIMPLIDKDVTEVSEGKLENAKLIRAQDFRPEKGGLFDESKTGGLEGEKWTHFDLPEPMPNPIARENVATLLNMTLKEFDQVLNDELEVDGMSGGKYLKDRLSRINIDKEIKELQNTIKTTRGNNRNKAIKKLKILLGSKEHGIHPKDFMVTKVPVIPPKFRPVIPLETGSTIVADANNLYQDFALANEQYKEASKILPKNDPDLINLKKNLQSSMQKLSGMEDGISEAGGGKQLKGFTRQIIGAGSPKYGMFQEKVIDRKQDYSGRAVIIPDPTLGLDEAGVPEEIAWTIYEPFVIRELVRQGMQQDEADRELQGKTKRAKDALMKVMNEQLVVINRDPSLHRFNAMAMRGKLSNERTLSLPPLIEKGFNADHDGDAMNIHVLATDEAVQDAKLKMLPSQNIFTGRNKSAYWIPEQEAVLGLYRATKQVTGKPIKKFRTKKEAIEAYERKEIKITDPIEIEIV